jgi:hypothetical protein
MQRYSWLRRSWRTAYDPARATRDPAPVKKTKALALVFVAWASTFAAAADTLRRRGQHGQPLRGRRGQLQRGKPQLGQPQRGQPPHGQRG